MIKLALVGKGIWGKNYIHTIENIPHCKLPKKYIKTYDFQDLFSFKDIDGVIITTPASTHFQIAKKFLEREYNVLIEKPVTTRIEDALILKKIAENTKSILMVGHIYQYHPAFIELKNLVRNIGRIQFIQTEAMDWGPIRSDVSALWDWAIHDISISIELAGEKPISVSAWGINVLRPKTNLYDVCILKLKFSSSLVSLITTGWLSPIKKRSVKIVGKHHSLVFDDIATRKLALYRNHKNINISYPKYSTSLPLTNQVLEFIDCIKNKRKPKTDIDKSLLTVKIIECAEKSIRADGKEITIM